MVGKQLSALLQILRSNGVTRYVAGDVVIELGPVPPRRLPAGTIDMRDATTPADEDDEEEGDPRFLLERLGQKHFPGVKGDPRKNRAPQ